MRLLSACLITATALICGCNTNTDNTSPKEPQHISAEPDDTMAYTLDRPNSILNWKGSYVIGNKTHHGTLKFKSGEFTYSENKLASGRVVVDMTSIKDVDLDDPAERTKLVRHLSSEDFFNIDKFPEATFELTSLQEKEADAEGEGTHTVSGNLTIKGITKPISFPIDLEYHPQGFNVTGTAVIDRSKWDVKYGSKSFFPNLVGDKVIKDEVEFSFTVKSELKGSIH
jgi:polyisoprenoid-binding protein YceI